MAEPSHDTGKPSVRPAWRGYAQLASILFVIAAALYFARAPARVDRGVASDPSPESVRPTVRVIRPTPTEQALNVELTGTVNLKERVRVASEVVGRVAWVSPDFTSGGSVAADEPFIRIDPAEFELQAEAARMAVREAEARVWVEQAGAEEDVRAFEREYPGAEASEAVRRLPSIAEAEARLARAQAELRLAELRLERTNISLPYDGRVMSSDIEVGELVGPVDRVDGPRHASASSTGPRRSRSSCRSSRGTSSIWIPPSAARRASPARWRRGGPGWSGSRRWSRPGPGWPRCS